MTQRREPRWLSVQIVEAIHTIQLEQHGGLPCVRDAGALESALGRPRQRWHYGGAEDIADCGAAYGFAFAKNHGFSDGNKRTAFVAMATFTEWNGFAVVASEAEVVATMLAVAEGSMSEQSLADWFRENSKRIRRPAKKK